MAHIQKINFSKIVATKTVINKSCSPDLKVATKNHFKNNQADV